MTRPRPRPAVLVDATLAAYHFRTAHGVDISADRIRQWRRRGYLAPPWRDNDPRYDLAELVAFARRQGLLDTPECAESCA